MNKFYLPGLGLLLVINSLAQPKNPEVATNLKDFGTNLITQAPINGIEHEFSERIHDYYLDTLSNTITLQLRGLSKNGKWLDAKGEIILYNLTRKAIQWRKPINYNINSFDQLSNLLIESNGNKSYSLNPENGEAQWEIRNSIYYINQTLGIGLGYEQSSLKKYSNIIKGIDLNNGKEIWSREINRDYGWNGVRYLNDSVLVIASSGLHAVNLNTGKGWDYHTITGQKDYTAMAVGNAVGLALGVLTGTYVTTSGPDIIRNIVSNQVMDSAYLYFASREKLSCIEKTTGAVIWSQGLPKDLISKSDLISRNGILYLINRGFAFMGQRQLKYGKPFFAAYRLSDGNQLYMTPISTDEIIASYSFRNETVSMVVKNSIMNYSLTDGRLITLESYPTEEVGDLKYFVGRHVYLSNDSTYVNLALSDILKQFVFTSKGKTLILNEQLKLEGQIDFKDLFVLYETTEDYTFLLNEDKTIIVTNDLKKIAEVKATKEAFLINKTLFGIKDKSLIEVDLRDVLKE